MTQCLLNTVTDAILRFDFSKLRAIFEKPNCIRGYTFESN
jgi:hypothetical protein